VITANPFWLVEYSEDMVDWEPCYYSEFETLAAAQNYANQWPNNSTLRITKVTREVIAFVSPKGRHRS
jgi:hypothetical protein